MTPLLPRRITIGCGALSILAAVLAAITPATTVLSLLTLAFGATFLVSIGPVFVRTAPASTAAAPVAAVPPPLDSTMRTLLDQLGVDAAGNGPADAPAHLEDRRDSAELVEGDAAGLRAELYDLAGAVGAENRELRRRLEALEGLLGGQTATDVERWLHGGEL